MAGNRHVHVRIVARISGRQALVHTTETPIPPDYTDRDVDALAVRRIEDAAFALTRDAFNRQPTRTALRAATARLYRIGELLAQMDPADAAAIQEVLDTDNEDALAQWGEDPDGP